MFRTPETRELQKETAAAHFAGPLVVAFATGGRACASLRMTDPQNASDAPVVRGGVQVLEGSWDVVIDVPALLAERIHFDLEADADAGDVTDGICFADLMSLDEGVSISGVREAVADIDSAARLLISHREFLEWAIETLLTDGEVTAEAAEEFFHGSRASGRQGALTPGAA
jgi:hypothetical protein